MEVSENGHSLSVPDGIDFQNIRGMVHRHTCQIKSTESNNSIETIQVPSNKDLYTFWSYLNAAAANNVDISGLYLTTVTCNNTYTLLYSGTIDDLPSPINNKELFIEMNKKYLEIKINCFWNTWKL